MVKEKDAQHSVSGEPEQQQLDEQQQETAATEAQSNQPSTGASQDAEQSQQGQEPERLQNQIVRLSADIENMRRRHQQDLARAHSYGLEKFMRELMPVIDSLGMALANTDDSQHQDNPLYEGVALTHQMLVSALEKFGLNRIEPQVQDTFTPQLHEAMTTAATTDMPPNSVVQVIQCGYRLNDRLLRPARVIVSIESPDKSDAP